MNSPSPTGMLEKGEDGTESENLISRAGTGIGGEREKPKDEKPQTKKSQVAVRRKNKYRYIMHKIYAPILL